MACSSLRALLLGLVLATQSGRAQLPTGINVNQFRPTWGSLQHFSVDTTDVLEHLQVQAGFFTSYAKNPLTVRGTTGSDRLGTVIADDLGLTLSLAVGVMDLLDIGLVIPMSPWRSGDSTIAGFAMPDVSEFALGDIRVGARARVYGDPLGIVRVGLRLEVAIPTGVGPFASSPLVSVDPSVLLDVRYRWFRLSTNLGARNLLRTETVANLEIGPELTFGLATAAEVTQGLDLVVEAFGAAGLTGGTGDALDRFVTAPLEWLAGARYRHPLGFSAGLGAGMGVTQGYGSPDVRVVLQLGMTFDPLREERAAQTWSEPSNDPPGEGGMEPDPDNPGKFRARPGAPGADTDGDGLPDNADSCPSEAEDKDENDDGDGCPEPDNDADGILDVDDGGRDGAGFGVCRDAAEDLDGFSDEDGCTDEDNDGDGVLDVSDECPMAPEDGDGFEEEDGCPDDDNDGDGFLDVNDGPTEAGSAYGSCRNAPEDTGGDADVDRDHPDGCPDAVVVRGVCRLEPIQVQFAVGNAKILPKSQVALRAFAGKIVGSSWLRRLRVEGHSDGRGDPGTNLALSTTRAEAVMALLVASGVAPELLEGIGRGESVVPSVQEVPTCARPESAKCQAARRRVEFVVLATEQGRCSE